MSGKKKSWLVFIVAAILTIWCFQPKWWAHSAFGQIGIGNSAMMNMQQWSRQQQMSNFVNEGAARLQQRAIMNRQSRNQSYMRYQTGRGQQYSNNIVRYPTTQRYQAPIHVGDEITVLYMSTPVKIGEKTITLVDAGTKLNVIERQGDWVGVQVQQGESPITGWISINNVQLANRQPSAL